MLMKTQTSERYKRAGTGEDSQTKLGRPTKPGSPSYVSFKQNACYLVLQESALPTLCDRRMLQCRYNWQVGNT